MRMQEQSSFQSMWHMLSSLADASLAESSWYLWSVNIAHRVVASTSDYRPVANHSLPQRSTYINSHLSPLLQYLLYVYMPQ